MGMKLPPELERQILNTPGVVVTYAQPLTLPSPPEPKAVQLIEPGIALVKGMVTLLVAFQSVSETNQRDWKARSRRSGMAWRAIREAIGPHLGLLEPLCLHYTQGGALRVTFTRLGGRMMDRSNLPAAMKGLEDATAYCLGADDGHPAWHSFFEQQPTSPVGVMIQIEEYR
jgi:hypothetical protein